jgi:hypothetical protein
MRTWREYNYFFLVLSDTKMVLLYWLTSQPHMRLAYERVKYVEVAHVT